MLTRWLGRTPYLETVDAMRAFTETRGDDTPDELWMCEHDPIYTQGVAGRADTVHDAGDIPVVFTNRGGQVTYHGPGQVVAYPLVDLRRQGCFVKEYVYRLETSVLRVLEGFGVTGHRVAGAPGLYVRLDDPFGHARLDPRPPREHTAAGKRQAAGEDPFRGLGKIAALGVKVTRHCTYHGVALNVAMDLSPFLRIDPCGYAGLRTVDLSTIGVQSNWQEAANRLSRALSGLFEPRVASAMPPAAPQPQPPTPARP